VPLVFLELRLEPLEQRERIGGRPGETSEHAVVVDPPHLARGGLDDDVAERHLAIASEAHDVVAAYRKDGGAVKGFHVRRDLEGAPGPPMTAELGY
jgi:hypothetical protein